uniref:Prefoldin subunit 3 n=1 Tax=Nothobranchius furzeri TaxID=105023 RepID=A0A8C6LI93_NOTFU
MRVRQDERSLSNMTATIDNSNASQANKKKHLGIPEAVFVEDVDSFMKLPGNETADSALRKLDEQYQKYKYMELNLSQKKLRLKNQIPQITQTLEILRHMQKKKETTERMETHFLLADNVYCKASVPPTDKVSLWLGANVMLEYDINEAQALLEKNLSTASRNLETLEEDLDFLRDQFTTTEVSILPLSGPLSLICVYGWPHGSEGRFGDFDQKRNDLFRSEIIPLAILLLGRRSLVTLVQ